MNLIQLIKDEVGDIFVDSVSKYLKEDASKVRLCYEAGLPSMMDMFTKTANDDTGLKKLWKLVSTEGYDGRIFEGGINDLFKGGNSTFSLMDRGESLVNTFLGDWQYSLINGLANFSGVQHSSASGIMKMIAPLALGIIGKKAKDNELDINGLKRLLSSQRGHIGASLPSGFSHIKTASENTKTTKKVEKPIPPVKKEVPKPKPETKVVPPPAPKPKPVEKPKVEKPKTVQQKVQEKSTVAQVSQPATYESSDSGFSFKKLLPWLLVLLGLIALVFLIRKCTSNTVADPKSKTEIADSNNPASVQSDTVPKAEVPASTQEPEISYNDNTSNNSSTSSSSSSSSSTEGPSQSTSSFARSLAGISNGGTIDFDCKFRSTAVIRGNSRRHIQKLVDFMQSNPSRQLMIESSDARHGVSIKKALMDAGIDRNRISTSQGGSGVQLTVG